MFCFWSFKDGSGINEEKRAKKEERASKQKQISLNMTKVSLGMENLQVIYIGIIQFYKRDIDFLSRMQRNWNMDYKFIKELL